MVVLLLALVAGSFIVYSLFSLRTEVDSNVRGIQSAQSIPFLLEADPAVADIPELSKELTSAVAFLTSLSFPGEAQVEFQRAVFRFNRAAEESILNLSRAVSQEGRTGSLNRLHLATGVLSNQIRNQTARLSQELRTRLDQVSFLLILLFVVSSMNIGLHVLLQRHRNRLLDMQEELRVQATHDPLTGRWNRRGIEEILGAELARTKRSIQSMGVMVVDLDNFKAVNDRFGHQAGDRMLKEVAACMASQLRPYDELGRYGGEEFLVVTPGCSYEHAMMVGERLRRGVEGLDIVIEETRHPITVSVGVAVCDGRLENTDGIIRRADGALYEAKNQGRNRVVGELDRFSSREGAA